jgi:two-component system phosphate regulon response regulator PhoB
MLMARLLLVEDNEDLAHSVVEVMAEKHEVLHASDIAAAKNTLKTGNFDLLLLDVTLPDGSGFDFYEDLLNEGLLSIPVIFLTGQSDLDSRMKGLSLGAQDYILKPFYVKELMLRIEMRLQQFEASSSVFICGDLKFEKDQHRVSHVSAEKKALNLTPNEYKILALLAASPGVILSRANIVDAVWGKGFSLSDKAVNTHISNLRKKIPAGRCKIVAIEGKGYSLQVD